MLCCTKANIRWYLGKVLEKNGYRNRMELLIAVDQKNLVIVTPDKTLDKESYYPPTVKQRRFSGLESRNGALLFENFSSTLLLVIVTFLM